MIESVQWDGKPIKSPGLFAGIPLARYHGPNICIGPSVSSSGLRKIMSESPAHFFAEWTENPKRIEPKDTKAFIIGRACHHLLLGERWFSRLFVLRPDKMADRETGVMKDWHSNRIECKTWAKEQRRLGKTILTAEDIVNIQGMAISLGRHPLVMAGILRGQIERSIIWRDKTTGLWLRSRPDAIPTDSGDFADAKTCLSVKYYEIQKSLNSFGYHQQGALVRMGAQQVLGIDYRHFTFSLVCIEKENPWCPRVVQLKDEDLDLGEQQNRKAIETIANCIKKNDWPGPGDKEDAVHVGLSDWFRERAQEQLK